MEYVQGRRERPLETGACERDEHEPSAEGGYGITSSARRSRESGTVSPSAFAVLRLMTRSNLVGCSIGKSPGLAPWSGPSRARGLGH